MDDETRRLLKEILELERSNQVTLSKLLNYQRWARAWSFLKVAIVVGSAVGIYYFFQPFITSLTGKSESLSKAFFNSIEILSGASLPNLSTTTPDSTTE